MAKLQSAEELGAYCLRRLGSPVINIEIDSEQLSERIDDSISYFIERHFAGTTESFYKLSITQKDTDNKYITVPEDLVVVTNILKESSNSSIEVMDDFEYNMMDQMMRSGTLEVLDYYLTMTHLSMINDMFSASRQFTFNSVTRKIVPQFDITNVGSANLIADATDISTNEWTSINSTLTGNDAVVPNGKTIGDTITSVAPGVFGLSQLIDTTYYVRGLYTVAATINPGTYTGQVVISLLDGEDTLVKSKTVSLIAGKWEYFYLEGTYGSKHRTGMKIKIETVTAAAGAGETIEIAGISLFKNNVMLIQGYSAIDPEDSVNVYDDRWIKKYSTALIKYQWGSNISKYRNIEMPGGVVLEGDRILQEAAEEIAKLEEEFSLQYELPIDFVIG